MEKVGKEGVITVEEAKALIGAAPPVEERRGLVLYQPHWHKGVIGIAAARLATDLHRPTIILTKSDDMLVGSARSIEGLDLL